MKALSSLSDAWKAVLVIIGSMGIGSAATAATVSFTKLPKRLEEHSKVAQENTRLIQENTKRIENLENMMQTWLCLEINDRTGGASNWRACLQQEPKK